MGPGDTPDGFIGEPGQDEPDYSPTDAAGDENAAETWDYATHDDQEDTPREAMGLLEDMAQRVEFSELITQLMTSTSPEEAQDAANMLRERGWLLDGDMKSVFLQGADLRGVDFSEAILIDADMDEVNLSFANLSDADLDGASLRDANLEGANLEGANLAGADLTGANLKRANLDAADLRDAEVTLGQLAQAASLEDAILPDGSQHDQIP